MLSALGACMLRIRDVYRHLHQGHIRLVPGTYMVGGKDVYGW